MGEEEIEIPGGEAFLKGRRLQQSGEWGHAIEFFRTAADIYSLVADYALYQMAQSALQEGDPGLAMSSLEKLLNLYPNTPVKRTAQLELANLYFNAGEPTRAAPLIKAALPGAKDSEETVALMLMLVKSYAASGDILKSDSLCWQLIHGWPSTSEALEAAGIVQNINTPKRWLAVANVNLLNKKTEKAIEILERLEADPAAGTFMSEVLLYKAQALMRKGQKESALRSFDMIIADYPDSSAAATAYFERAKHERSLGLLEEALVDYAHLIQRFARNPLVPQALWERAKIFEKLEDPREYAQYEQILTKYPRYGLAVSSMMYWGMKHYRAGRYAEARKVFEKLLTADTGFDANADAAFWIAKCSVAEGKTSSAKVQLASIIERFEGSYQEFRARSILKALAKAESVYFQQTLNKWQGLLVYNRRPFVSFEVDDSSAAYESVEKELSYLDRKILDRLKLLMCNNLFEAQWELAHISKKTPGMNARYLLAWSLFHTRAYNDSIKLASSLRKRIAEPPRGARIQYLLYPPAYPDIVLSETKEYGTDPMLTLAVMREESHFRERVISRSDARGLMQIIPPTGEWLAGKVFGPAAFDIAMLFQPSVNIELGTYYLRYLLDRFDNNMVLAIAAYNWGPTSLTRWMGDSPPGDMDVFIESIPAQETRRYVKKVLRSYVTYHSLYPSDYFKRE